MENSTNNNSKEIQEFEKLQIQSNFYKSLTQELFTHSLKMIEDYQKVIAQMKISNSLSQEVKSLNHHISGLYYTDINSRKRAIKLMRNSFKAFNKSFNKKLYSNNK